MFGFFNKAEKARIAELEVKVGNLIEENQQRSIVQSNQAKRLKAQDQRIADMERVAKHLANRPTTIKRVEDRTHSDAPAMFDHIRNAIPADLHST